MKIEEIWEEYKESTNELTSNGRKLAFGAAAVCWFFKSPDAKFPTLIIFSLLFIVFFFTFDILQFLSSVVSLRSWAKKKEKEMYEKNGNLEGDVEKPGWLTRLPFSIFMLKILFLFLAFFFLIWEFHSRI